MRRAGKAGFVFVFGGALLWACTLTMPSDDELRGTHTPQKGGGAGQTGGSSGSGGFPNGGSGGQSGGAAGGGGAPAKCSASKDWTSIDVPISGSVKDPRMVATTGGDVALGWMSGNNPYAEFVTGGTPGSPVQLSNSGNGSELRIAWNDAANRLGATWMDPAVDFASLDAAGSKQGKFVYSSNVSDPDGKAPQYADVAASGSNFEVAWYGFAGCAPRIFAVLIDASGNQIGVPYARLTDTPLCSWAANLALIATGTNHAVTWADNRSQCQVGTGGACGQDTPVGSPWSPQVFWLQGDISGDVGEGAQAPITTTSGADYPAIAWDGNQAGVAWLDSSGSTRSISFRIAAPGATASALSTDPPADAVRPSVAAAANGFGVAWQSGANTYFAAADSAGKKAFDVSLASDGSGEPATIAWNGTAFVIAYVRSGGIRLMTCAP